MSALPSLRQLRPSKPTLFRYQYKPNYAPPPDLAGQEKEQNPLAVRNRHIFEQRPRIGLWYAAKAAVSVAPKRLPRSNARRKLMLAFQESLSAHGLDDQGLIRCSVEADEAQRDSALTALGDEPAPIDLKGSLTLIPQAAILTAKHDELSAETGKLVRYLMRYQWLSRDTRQAESTEGVRTRGRGWRDRGDGIL